MPGPSKSVDIFLRLHGARKFAKEVEAAGTQLEAMGVKGASSLAAFSRKAESLKSFGRSWTKNVSLPIAGLAAISGKMAIDFHQAMSLVQTQAGASAKETRFLEKSVLRMTEKSKFGATEMADALFRVRSAGFKGTDALGILEQGKNLSTMGNSDLEMTTKALTGAAKNLGTEKLSQVKGLAAEMNAIVGTGDMRMEELQDALSTGVLPSFVAAGLGMRDYGDALTVMTDRNVPAQMASTRLRTAISMLVPHSKKAEEALQGVGIQSEAMATIMRKKGLPETIKFLAEHLSKLSPNKQNRVEIEAFGGAKSSATIQLLVENYEELFEKQKLIREGLKKTPGELKVAEQQPGTELLKAWHQIEVTLIKVGDELLPAVVPGLKDLAGTFIGVAHAFTGLPPEVQAVAAGMLILTGPVASGLGYYASGVGKALKFTAKLGRASSLFGATMSKSVMTERSGLTGAFGAASEEMGVTGALKTAKGFALSLGPAVAAIGIGNIVTSATSGDWKDAGWEAGGALAGGVAGAIVGGPLGAMLGVGVGSIGGELLEGLFSSEKKIRPLQAKLASSAKGVKKAFEEQRQASKSLKASGEAIVGSHKREKNASQAVHKAEHALAQIRHKAGINSQPVLRAENELAKAARRRKEAVRAVSNAERKHGSELRAYKEVLRYTVLEERHRLNVLGRAHGAVEKNLNAMRGENRTLGEMQPTIHRLMGINEQLNLTHKKLSSTLLGASKQVGPQYSTFLREAGRRSLEFGSKTKAAKVSVDNIKNSMNELKRSIEQAGTAMEKGTLQQELLQLGQVLPGAEEGLAAVEAAANKGKSRGGGGGKKKAPKSNAQDLIVPAGRGGKRHTKVDGHHLLDRLEHALQISVPVSVEMDGKVVGEGVARRSIRKSNRE